MSTADFRCLGSPSIRRTREFRSAPSCGSSPNNVETTPLVTVIARDGTAHSMTFAELDGRANQWGRALTTAGARDRFACRTGDSQLRAVGTGRAGLLEDRRCPGADALGPARLGTVSRARSDCPRGHRGRTKPHRHSPQAPPASPPDPLPDVVSPKANGICSSGSTGLPKVIRTLAQPTWTLESRSRSRPHWTPDGQPQTILVPGPMYHTNGFAPLTYLLGGDGLVILEKFDAATVLDVDRELSHHELHRHPDDVGSHRRIPDIRDRDLSSIAWILQGAAVMPQALLRTWFDLLSPEQVVMAYGMTEGLGLTALRGDERRADPGSVGRGFRDTEVRILDQHGQPVAAGELGEVYLRSPMSAGVPVSGWCAATALDARRVPHGRRHRTSRRRRRSVHR